MINFVISAVLRATGNLPCAVIAAVVGGFALPWTFLAILSLAQRLTPLDRQGRVSALVTLVLFGPQAPMQALGSLAIRYLTYRQVYLVGAALAVVATGALVVLTRRQPRISDS
jgi:MFS family permease